MTSIHVQTPLLTTHPKHSYPPPSTIFTKPPHYPISHAKRTRNNRLTVITCVSDNPETPQPRLDRRNMLLGLGGSICVGNSVFVPSSSADPVPIPDLNNCSQPTDAFTGQPLDATCCLKPSPIVRDYKPPPFFQMKIRPPAHTLSAEFISKYNTAVDRMRRLPSNDPRSFTQQANIHCAYCNNVYKQLGTDKNLEVHFSWLFFPFHRWYMYFYERILGKLIGDPTFALPFWNWDNIPGMTIPLMFCHPASALYDEKRDPKHQPPALVDLGMTGSTDPDQLIKNNLTEMYKEMVSGVSDAIDFMGCPVREGGTSTPAMQGTSERGSHTAIHLFGGDPNQPHYEDMGNFYSAGRDPLFYSHHSNVDRMWALWRAGVRNPNIKDPDIHDPDFLGSSFLFYDEDANLVRVYVRDAVDHTKLGYDFVQVDIPWLDYKPPPQSKQAKAKRLRAIAGPKPQVAFPFSLEKTTTVFVKKTKNGAAREKLAIDFTVDIAKFLKFDVYVNDEDDRVDRLDKAAYAGTYAQVPHQGGSRNVKTRINLSLTSLYKDMDVADEDTLVVTLVPRHEGPGITIGGIKVIEEPETAQIVYECPST